MWRFTAPCLKIYHPTKSCRDLKEMLEKNELKKRRKFHNPISRKIARVEMVNTLSFLHPAEAREVLGADYRRELGLVERTMGLYT